MTGAATGISWYHRRDYPALLNLFADAASFPASYDDWLSRAQDLERQVKRTGGRVIRVYVDPESFAQWCRQTGHPLNASGRVAFSSAVAARTISRERADSNKKTKKWNLSPSAPQSPDTPVT